MPKTFLKVGDVFRLTKGMKVMTNMPSKFSVSNRRFSNTMSDTVIEIGEEYQFEATMEQFHEMQNDISKSIIQAFGYQGLKPDEDEIKKFISTQVPQRWYEKDLFCMPEGEFVEIDARSAGGGTGHGPHDVYPDGHQIIARKLINGVYDPTAPTVRFYQSGCFTNQIDEELVPIRTMTPTFE
jgi:hypothetical protein